MIVIPAVDVLDHVVVQLVGGVPGSQQIVLSDPENVARSWVAKGAPYLHLVDLDGAFGRGNNLSTFKRIARNSEVPVEIGGGLRSEETVGELIDSGADRVIVGTRAIKEPDWLISMSKMYPGRIVLGMDTKGDRITIKGWQESAELTMESMFDLIRDLPLAGVLNTNVDVEGKTQGIDPVQARRFISRCPHKVIASGGITTEKDAISLSEAGAYGAVVGLSIYKGHFRPWDWKTPWEA
jgi:phosphoribosylformimino-5-aminoimidazole carboxamide ribotide isomerase